MIELNYSYNHEKLREVQDELLDILKSFDKICRENKITYFLYGGTLLGAIRHKGFIPWDDDLDISMTRAEFNKLNRIMKEHHDFELVYNTLWVPRFKSKSSDRLIDIFIFDKAHENESKHLKTLFKLKMLQGMMKKRITFKNKSVLNNAKQVATWVMGWFFSENYKLNKYFQISKSCEGKDCSSYFVSSEAFHYLNMTFEKAMVEFTEYADFEGLNFPVPKQYNDMLIKIYGDYMKLPAIDKRVPEHLEMFKETK